MKPSHIDFAPRTLRRALYRITPLTWLAFTLALGVLLGAAYGAYDVLEQTRAESGKLNRLQAKASERNASKPAPLQAVISPAQATAVNAAIAQMNLPWRDVLDAVEAATPKNIALLALEPDARKSSVKGTAEAKTSDDMIAYIEQLKKQSFFVGVALTRHETNEQDPNRPLRFQFEAQWSEAAQ